MPPNEKKCIALPCAALRARATSVCNLVRRPHSDTPLAPLRGLVFLALIAGWLAGCVSLPRREAVRSEEHTSELQSQ